MDQSKRLRFSACGLTCIVWCVFSSTTLAAGWNLVDLGSLPAPNNKFATGTAINEFGEVVGISGTSAVFNAVQFSGGTAQYLGPVSGRRTTVASDINEQGVIVGSAERDSSDSIGFVYDHGVMTNLGSLGGGYTYAFAINNAGTIVGRSAASGGAFHAFMYSNGTMTDIGAVAGYDINELGQIVGTLDLGGNGFSYSNGILQNLGRSVPWSLNDRGLIVGETFNLDTSEVRAAYFENGSWHGIGLLSSFVGDPFDNYSSAYAVNNRDQIVGSSTIADDGPSHAFIYSNGVMTDLNSLIDAGTGWELSKASDINDRGQITGTGLRDGALHAYLLTPTLDEFQLDVTYENPLVVDGAGQGLPEAVTSHFVLRGVAGMPGSFRLDDVVSALVEFADGTWTEANLTSFGMSLGPGGVDDIATLSYNFESIVTPSGQTLSLHNKSFQLYVDGHDSGTGESFAYYYPDSSQALAVVPEPSSALLAALAGLLVFIWKRRDTVFRGFVSSA